MKLLAAAALILMILGVLMISYAHAEMQGLYLNIDGKSWTLVSSHISEEECDKAARRAMREHKAMGAGCAIFTPERNARTWNPPAPDGSVSKEQQWRDDSRQIERNRQERYEMQFSRPIPVR